MTEKAERAAPVEYTEELAEEICLRMGDGESLSAVCRDEHMPTRQAVHRWLNSNEEFKKMYVFAHELQADFYFDEIKEIADDGADDFIKRARQDGSVETVVDHEHIQRSRLRVDARKWKLARMNRKKFGEHSTQEFVGADGEPVSFTMNIVGK